MNSYLELVRQIEKQKAETERLKTLESPRLNSVINDFLLIPGLIGFWPMSSVQRSTGNAYDLSGQSRTLTYNGNPTYNIHSDLTPYIDLDGTGDYLSRADEADLDILGTETIYAAAIRGLTWGLWVRPEETGTVESIFTKWSDVPGNYSYRIFLTTTDVFRVQISDDGTNTTLTDSAVVSMETWHFVIGRFDPSTSVDLFVNGIQTTTATARASVFSGAADLNIGAQDNGTNPFQGCVSLCFLSANMLSDDLIEYLYRRSKTLFI